MVGDFERRLAQVLGARLAAPLTGQVFVPPGPAPGAAPTLVLGVTAMRPLPPEFRTRRPEVVPGSTTPRRVVRLECDVTLEARPGAAQGRPEQLSALDAALFVLDADEFQSGAALTDATDRGFLLQELRLAAGAAPLVPTAPAVPPVALTLQARGLFWPIGQPGQAGIAIGEIRVRGASLPVEVVPAAPVITAGGPPVEFTLRVRTVSGLDIRATGTTALPFIGLALAVVQPDGRPGNGTLAGGDPGLDAIRIVTLAGEEAAVTYTPPATAGPEELVIAMDDHEGGLGVEIGRVPLAVRSA